MLEQLSLPKFKEHLVKEINKNILHLTQIIRRERFNQAQANPVLEFEEVGGTIRRKENSKWICYSLPFRADDPENSGTIDNYVNIFVEQKKWFADHSPIVWHTTADKVKIAQEFGGIAGDALLSKAICAIGKYRSQVAKVYFETPQKYVSELANAKEDIAMYVIKRLRLLEPLESLINTDSPRQIISAIRKIKSELESLQRQVKNTYTAINSSIIEDIKALNKLHNELDNHHSQQYIQSFCKNHLIGLIKTLAHHAVESACHENETKVLAEHSSVTRGLLHDALGEARYLISEHTYPSLSESDGGKITAESQLVLGENGTTKVAVNSSEYDLESDEEQEQFLRAIKCAETGFNIKEVKDAAYTNATTWNTVWKNTYSGRNFRKNKKPEFNTNLNGLDYQKVMHLLPVINQSHLVRALDSAKNLGKSIGHAFYDAAVSTAYRVKIVLSAFKQDYQDGHQDPEKQSLININSEASSTLAVRKPAVDPEKEAFADAANKVLENTPEFQALINNAHRGKTASGEKVLPYRPYDLLTGAVNGVLAIPSYFIKEVHNKHPTIGAMSALIYGYCFLSFYPEYMPDAINNKTAVDIVRAVGLAMCSGKFSGGISAGFTFYKAFFALMNLFLQGPNSWIYNIFADFSKNIGKILPVLIAAYALGYTLVNVVGFKPLAEDVGNVPEIEEIFAGLKVMVIAYEFFNKNKLGKSYFGQVLGDAVQFTILPFRAMASIVTRSSRPWVELKNVIINIGRIFAYNAINVINKTIDVIDLASRGALEVTSSILMLGKKLFTGIESAVRYCFPMKSYPAVEASVSSEKAGWFGSWLNIKYQIANSVYEHTSGAVQEKLEACGNLLGRNHVEIAKLIERHQSLSAKHADVFDAETESLAANNRLIMLSQLFKLPTPEGNDNNQENATVYSGKLPY